MTAQGSGNSDTVHFEKERGVNNVQVERGVAHVTVDLAPETLGKDRLALLQAFAAANVPVFMVKLIPGGMSFALRDSVVDAGMQLIEERRIRHALMRDLGLVAVVAGAMRDLSGVMASIYQALVSADIVVRQTGDAYNAVLCLVAGADADRAAEALRTCFFRPVVLPAEPVGVNSGTGTGLRGL